MMLLIAVVILYRTIELLSIDFRKKVRYGYLHKKELLFLDILYNPSNVAETIKKVCRQKNIIIKNMLVECKLGSNTMSALYHDKMIVSDRLAAIADYLDVSVDYLLGRTDKPEINK